MQRCKLFCRIVLLFCACFFRASLGFADTISCSAGWYLPAGATECIACPQNSSSAAGADICTCLDGFTVTGTSDGAVTTTTSDCKLVPEFTITTTDDAKEFSFSISAAGDFVIDWGDGSLKTITKPDTTNEIYTHNYTTAGAYTIGISGQATAYAVPSSGNIIAAISFYVNSSQTKIASIDGSLGAIFGTLNTGTNNQPRFYETFYSATNITGSIPENLFAGISGAPASNMFVGTFEGCSGLTGSIPENLFAGISGAPAYWMFGRTFSGCSGLTGSIPENLFAGISGTPAEYMFEVTFKGCSGLTGSIPENLFGDISGAPADGMFSGTFSGCSGLTGPSARINGKYLYDIWVDEEGYYFADIYQNDTKLSDYPYIPTSWGGLGEKPEFTLTTTSDTTEFSFNISAAGEFMVDWGDGSVETIIKPDTTNEIYTHNYATADTYTIGIGGQATAYNTRTYTTAAISFYVNSSQTKIASIDGSLGAIFGTLSTGTNNQPRFYQTFYNATNMTGSIPENLFVGISGAPAELMFEATFKGCSGLTGSIPENLFAGISGAPASHMFDDTFYGCSGLTGAIPDGLFAGISGAPAIGMFYRTFFGCSGLTGAIPAGLFAGISGKPASDMFCYTFYNCSGLTGAIPAGLFAGISGAPASGMFVSTFSGCTGLTSIPENLFGNISGTAQSSMFESTFYNCTSLTGPSARINGKYLYDIWPDASEYDVGMAYSNDTQLDDWPCIPTTWGGGGEDCSAPTAEFTLTTTADTREFSFNISAAGDFVIDWGDGTVETITKPDTTDELYSHNYATAGEYTIGIGGQATAYNTSTSTAAITFYAGAGYIQKMLNPRKIAKIDGSLGAIFGTLADGSQPRFYYTFRGGENLKQIPEGLFNGITGQPTSAMFFGTFGYCSGIKEIPEKLFAGIYGVPTAQIFTSTFEGCTSLTQIPQYLFSTISGTPASGMFRSTFLDCSSLISIPEGLFSGISGAPADNMYAGTFEGCTSLSGKIPQNLFGAIKGAPAQRMYFSTFARDANLSGEIPENLFGNLSGATQSGMFSAVFRGCTSLSGSSARINGQYLYDIWPDATETDVGGAYSNDTQLDDWPCIPQSWGGPGHNCTFNKFQITTTDNTNMFGVVLGAAGEFVIDWGDGKIQYINKSDTGWSEYTHDYSVSGQYTVKMTGSATAYSTWLSAISFIPRENVYSMSGSLASIFGTLPNGTQPLFSGAFQGCSELIEIPDNLFYGLTGKPAEWMFESTFSGCSSLTDLPPRLFDHFNGASPARSMFSGTFSGCTSLTQIPGDLFAGIYGPTAQELFRSTFSGCSSLTTVPGELFSMLRGAPSTLMFYETFGNCTSLTQIPENLFSSMSNKPATGLFQQTFSGCTSLTQIPAGLFANFSSTEQNMFNGTFQGCTSLTEIPVTLFKNISGNAADNSFESTFWGAKNIDKIISVGGSYTNWVPAEFFPKLESGANAFGMMFTETALAQECPRYYRRSDVFWAPQIMPKVVCVPDFDGCPIGEYFDTDMGECTTCESGNVCPGGDEPPASCSVITNGEYPMSDTGKSDIADCYKMCEFTSDTCKVTAHLDKVYYGYQCTYDCETLLGAPCEIVDNTCKEIKCPNTYEYVDYECRPCQRENALSFADVPGCNPDVCESGFHPGANGCYGDSIPCVAANATQAHRQWDSVRNVYGLCTIIECADGYHLVDNVCLPNTGACTLANGIGMREWDFDKNEWGPCVASSCNPGYTNDSSLTDEVGQECGRCFNAYDEYGNLAVSTYVRECEVATCMYQGELYALENNECRLICGEYSDETGCRYWDSSRKKCIHECMPGFTRW